MTHRTLIEFITVFVEMDEQKCELSSILDASQRRDVSWLTSGGMSYV